MVIALMATFGTGAFFHAAALADAGSMKVGSATMYADRNIVENASKSEDLSTLVAAVQAADLVETLSGNGPFTVFAPTNAAFAKLPEGTVETLLEPANKSQLQSILTYHVVPAKATADAVVRMIDNGGGEATVQTAQGGTLTLMLEGGSRVVVEDANGNVATVTVADVMQSNGIVHVIDTVLIP
jgi:uncharacterized surface protein with fasciclin (FAS1) repeats